MTLLVLYEELATYFVACISEFASKNDCDVHIIRKKVNEEAPFIFDLSAIKVYNREDFTNHELIELSKSINPDAILCGGWASKIYLRIVGSYNKKIPLVLGFDSQWSGSPKQIVASVISRFYITNKFNRCFVPGLQQKKFALKMGFPEKYIQTGAYSCDYDLFSSIYQNFKEGKTKHFPKRFLYVGRYVDNKGIRDLWDAFTELQAESSNEWELWCVGTGEIEPLQHEKIKHFGFVQPSELSKYIEQTGVFVLPSHFEPWGVVVHEFAAAGFPLIVSDQVGARITFVEKDRNGYIYKSGDKNELKNALKKMMTLSSEELIIMSHKSVELSKQITPQKWAASLMKLISIDPIQ
ncbi:MAG: glycosyltransferase [Bacteroidota bacterium]|nr:glycosyltransferase [Bacteroidota bacterium]